MFLEPGEHVLEARLDGHDPTTETVTATAGGVYELNLDLVEKPSAVVLPPSGLEDPPPAGPENGGTTPRDRERNWVPVYLAGGVAVVGLAAGIGLFLAADGKESDKDELLAKLSGENRCGSGTTHAAECAEIRELADDARQLRTMSFVGFGVGVAGAVAAVLLWPKQSDRSGLRATPAISSGGSSIWIHGTF